MLRATATALDFVLRLAFFAIAPFVLVLVAYLFPVTGAVVQIALALAVFFAGEAVRGLAGKSRVAAAVLRNQLEFEAYYRAHPPRPFLYYVFYPLLFPYWLWKAEPRREFLLYKGYTLASFVLLVVMQIVQYVRAFPPELDARTFWPLALGSFAVETVVVLMFLMPLVTSVVHFHTLGAPKRLAALLVIGAVSATVAIVRVESRRDPVVSFDTRARVRARAKAKPSAAWGAEAEALRVGWRALRKAKRNAIDSDGKVEGAPLEEARAALAAFYKEDEAYAFDLWYRGDKKSGMLVVYFEGRGKHPPIWLAMDHAGAVVGDAKKLPRGAFVAMKQAADAAE